MTYEEFIEEWGNEKNHILAKTSGSTGIPKEISLSKDFVKESALRTITFFNLNERSRLHSCVSPDFIGGKMMAVRATLVNAALTWEEPSNAPIKYLDNNEEIDLLAVVPSQILYILENISHLPKINNIIIGGSKIHPELKSKIAASGLNAYETYGMTETASHIALRKISTEDTLFETLPGITVRKNKNDCLVIHFESGMEITTNDICEIISERKFLIKGRKDNVIISGGKKINPTEIEDKISSLISYPFLIASLPDEKWGEKIILVIECDNTSLQPFSSDKFVGLLEKWEIPKEIYAVEKLPRTANNKLIRFKDSSFLLSSSHDNNLCGEEQSKQG